MTLPAECYATKDECKAACSLKCIFFEKIEGYCCNAYKDDSQLKIDQKNSAVLALSVGVVIAALGIIVAAFFTVYEMKATERRKKAE